MKFILRVGAAAGTAILTLLAAAPARAWNYPGHRMVNEVAVAALPADFPAWAKTPAALDRIAYLAGEPDRWRDTPADYLQHANGMNHYIDLEELADAGIAVDTLTPFRYDFVARFSAARAAHPDRFPAIDPAKNQDHSRAYPGFLPWEIIEGYAKVQVGFSILKAFERYGGSPEEIENAKENLIYVMGVMGHYVGDGAQPLHTTVHHHGWVGPNPNGFTTNFGFHAWIDGGFIAKAGITPAELMPRVTVASPLSVEARADGRDPVFVAILDYLQGQNALVVPLYQLEKEHKLEGPGPGSAEGRAFIDAQLVKGGEMLASLWLTAWRHSGPTHYLQSELIRRAQPAPAH